MNILRLVLENFKHTCVLVVSTGLILFASTGLLRAQDDGGEQSKFIFGVSTSANVSFTGLYGTAGLHVKKDNFAVYLGPKLAIRESYLPTRGPWGIVTSIFYSPTDNKKKLKSQINLEYQALFVQPFCPEGCATKLNVVHEYALGYGYLLQISERFSIFNSILLGRYSQVFYNDEFKQRTFQSGFNTIVKFGVVVDLQNGT